MLNSLLRLSASRPALLAISAACSGLLAFALWLQTQGFPPCPLCILARICFIGIAAFALLAAFLPGALRLFTHGLAALSAWAGVAVSARHQWVLLNPESESCGIDPLERWINQFSLTEWFPAMFEAQGACAMPLPPVFGLQVPTWSALWLLGLAVLLSASWWRQISGKRQRMR